MVSGRPAPIPPSVKPDLSSPVPEEMEECVFEEFLLDLGLKRVAGDHVEEGILCRYFPE